ncbi:MAG: phosphatidate phosphatase App1 family protein, partial [Gammaproteobacteria bacterium]
LPSGALPANPAGQALHATVLPARIVERNGARRGIGLPLVLLRDSGISVISDIDDTIKISQVRDKRELVQNTFCRPFQPAPGMAATYQRWAAQGAQFHYVTASPWQLYEPLGEFVRRNGFPAGTFHMKSFRAKDSSFLGLMKSPERYKPPVIEELFRQFPNRRFVLVGDSGEKDPEIYGALARKHPRQVARILIRDVTDEPRADARYRKAFRELSDGLWQVFQKPDALKLNATRAD